VIGTDGHILDDLVADEMTLLSEDVLARDWLREEEDKAWAHLKAKG
jgi:hypothetical protein